MRIGWHIPLPGPFSVGGTVARTRGGGGCLTLLGWLVIAGAVLYALFWPWYVFHNTPAGWGIGLTWLAVPVALLVWRGRVVTRRRQALVAAQAAAEQATAEQVAAERADRENRTYRMVVSQCAISPATGGTFTLTAPEGTMHLDVPADMALSFRSLRDKDVVQVTLTADGQGIEEFWHLARGNGATPRYPASFPHGLGGAIRSAPGQQEAAPEQEARSSAAHWPAQSRVRAAE
jgi:hypothetical protein